MSVGAFIGGFIVAILLDFVLSVVSFGMTAESSVRVALVGVSWALVVGMFWLLHRTNRWAGYGLLSGFASLFILLVVVGGISGPYACFGAFGYPTPATRFAP